MKFLLDTNICVSVVRSKLPRLIQKLRSHAAEELAISTITLAELRYGADKSQFPARNHTALNTLLAPIAISHFDDQCADQYGIVRSQLERRGLSIGPIDTLIAAHALRLKITLVTNNVREFSRVPNLQIEDWTIGT